jgi:hypothetical protein
MEKRVKQLLSLACMGVFTLVMAESSRAQNLLADPGFEQELLAPNPNTNGIAGWANFGGAQFLTTPHAHSGTNVLYTPDNGGGYNVPGTYQDFTASAGETFTLSGWVYTPNLLVSNSNDFAIFQMSFFTGAAPNNYAGGTQVGPTVGVNIGTPIGPTPSTVGLPQGVWTFVSVSAIASNAGINHVNSMGAYILDINADANADFYFDDMSLTESVPEPSTVALVLSSMIGGFLFLRKRRS